MLHELGIKYNTDKAYLHNFCDFYEKNLPSKINELWEIGILDGASLNMWADYYNTAKIIGFDIKDKSNIKFNSNNISTKCLDQGNINQLNELSLNKNIDIIVDDGSHVINHQILTFELLFNCLTSNGIYILEDLHTSTNLYSTYGCLNNKGTLQYLNDIILNIIPQNYPGQINTINIINNIKSINILSNNKTSGCRSITALITHI